MIIKINWNGFIETAMKNLPNESCGVLFSKFPYTEKEEWHLFYVPNSSDEPTTNWCFEKSALNKVKAFAKKNGLVRIGNIHTHPYLGEEDGADFVTSVEPSDTDLWYAKKYNDVVRGIVLLDKTNVHDMYFHDMFGNKINLEEEK
jgi:proteasome lid subunit RPN8/RPN11